MASPVLCRMDNINCIGARFAKAAVKAEAETRDKRKLTDALRRLVARFRGERMKGPVFSFRFPDESIAFWAEGPNIWVVVGDMDQLRKLGDDDWS